jgi:hypothetical protein
MGRSKKLSVARAWRLGKKRQPNMGESKVNRSEPVPSLWWDLTRKA